MRHPIQTGRIKVVARVRPLIHEDTDLPTYHHAPSSSKAECVVEDEQRGTILLRKPYYDSREIALDRVLGRDATQSQTYEVVARGVVDAVLEGYNGTVLAYGQTGTGKTHTIYGPLAYWRRGSQPQLELSGIITRAAMQIFAHAEARPGCQLAVTLSSLQIYQESISDLLGGRPASPSLQVREDPARGVYVDGLTEVPVVGPQQVLDIVHTSATHRATVATAMNRCSSRSHAMLLVRVEQRQPAAAHAGGGGGSVVRRGLLSVVDLAGSERVSYRPLNPLGPLATPPVHPSVCDAPDRNAVLPRQVSKSGSEGRRLDEAKTINRSVAALGNCIAALAGPHRAAHVPFRDSKLTRLLSDSLGEPTLAPILTLAPIPTLAPTPHLHITRRQRADRAVRLPRTLPAPLRRVLLHAAPRHARHGRKAPRARQRATRGRPAPGRAPPPAAAPAASAWGSAAAGGAGGGAGGDAGGGAGGDAGRGARSSARGAAAAARGT